MKQDDLRFAIDQLRKDKIIYATEAAATALTCILGLLFINLYLEGTVQYVLSILTLLIGLGYTTFMGIGNFMRLNKIKKLEKTLV